MKVILFLSMLLSLNGFSQSKTIKKQNNLAIDTFKWEKDFITGFTVIEGDTLWFVDHKAKEKYYRDSLPAYIRKQRIQTAGHPRTYHKMGQ